MKTNFTTKETLQLYTDLKQHDLEVISLFVGCLLGDASAIRAAILGSGKKKLKNTVISFGQGKKNILYLQYIKNFLSERNYTNKSELKITGRLDKRTNKVYFHMKFETYAFKSLNELHALFYRVATLTEINQGRRFIKIVPKNIVDLLSARALAFWFMDDGSFHIYNGSAIISTQGFMKKDVEILKQALEQKFNLRTRLQKPNYKEQYVLSFPKSEVEKLRQLILPYMIPSMYYKLGLNLEGNLNPLKKRRSIFKSDLKKNLEKLKTSW